MTDTTDAPNHCLFFDAKGLFFDAKGNGPSAVRLIDREVRELVEDGKTVVPRAFGLCWEVTGPLHFVEDGGFMLDAGGVTWLRDKLTAWLDAPRLAAREKAEVVAEFTDEYGTRTYLVRTPFEWGVADDPLARLGATWSVHEGVARELFREATGTSACDLCGTYRDDHDVDEDGIYTCTAERKTECEAACAKKGPTP
mgnify:CR=1 FL=1